MQIVLTSFRDANNYKGDKCSIARWQPTWSSMPEFPVNVKPVLDRRILGEWLPPSEYKWKYEQILYRKHLELLEFFDRIDPDANIILCCWCNLDKPNRWSKDKLYCHRILLGWWIEEHFKFARVIYADGAEVPIWTRS